MKIADDTMARYRHLVGQIWEQAIRNDFQGSDPYDGLKSRRLQPLLRRSRGLRLAVIQAVKRSPWNLRPLLDVPVGWNPKGLALFLAGAARLAGIVQLQDAEARREWLADALVCLASDAEGAPLFPGRRITPGAAARLVRKPAGNETSVISTPQETSEPLVISGPVGWGYDFPWQSRAFLQAPFAPTVVATSFVVDALATANNPAYAAMVAAAAEFVQSSLHHRETEAGVCISYSPRDTTCVYNASLFGAKILARAAATGAEDARAFGEVARQAASYVLDKQGADGSWAYGEAAHWHWVDNLHTGFVLQTLSHLSRASEEPAWGAQVQHGLAYYRRHLIQSDGTANYYPDHPYPLDAHTFAQAALTCLALRDLDPTLVDLARLIIDRAIFLLWDEKQCGFRFQQHARYRINTIHLRWSQAWMFRAMAEFLATVQTHEPEASP